MNKRILVVDDEAHIQHVLSLKLRNAGYEVITASDGEEGLHVATAASPDLVITDLQMPYMTGTDLCRAFAAREETRDIPVIILTARGYALSDDDLANGNIEVVSKPFESSSSDPDGPVAAGPMNRKGQGSRSSVDNTNTSPGQHAGATASGDRPGLSSATAGQSGSRRSSRRDGCAILSIARQCCRIPPRAVEQWNKQSQPSAFEAIPGLWLAPVPVQERRERTGYVIAAIPTDRLVDSEQFNAMCQAARLDSTMAIRMIDGLNPPSSSEVPRLAAMFRFNWHDQQVIDSHTGTLDEVGRELGETYEEINLLYTIIQGMNVVERPDRFIAFACDELLPLRSNG